MPRSFSNLIWTVGLAGWIAAVAAASLFWLPPARGFADPEAARLIVLHVPCAMVAVVAYLVSTIYAVLYLIRRADILDARSALSAKLGTIATILACISGMVFAKTQWGSAWNWDPRETSIVILLMVYFAYFALRSAIASGKTRARVSAAYNILACVIMPYLVFVMPRIMGGLHPSDTLTNRTGLSPEYRIVLGAAMIGASALYYRMMTTGLSSRRDRVL